MSALFNRLNNPENLRSFSMMPETFSGKGSVPAQEKANRNGCRVVNALSDFNG